MARPGFDPEPTRGQPAGAVLVGAIFMAIGHAMDQRGAFKFLFVIGALFLTLGVAGLVDPRLLLGATPEGKKHFPRWVYIVSLSAIVLGFAVGIGLLVFVYRAFP